MSNSADKLMAGLSRYFPTFDGWLRNLDNGSLSGLSERWQINLSDCDDSEVARFVRLLVEGEESIGKPYEFEELALRCRRLAIARRRSLAKETPPSEISDRGRAHSARLLQGIKAVMTARTKLDREAALKRALSLPPPDDDQQPRHRCHLCRDTGLVSRQEARRDSPTLCWVSYACNCGKGDPHASETQYPNGSRFPPLNRFPSF